MICRDIYKNLNIVNRDSFLRIGPCCISSDRPVSKIDFYNDQYLKRLREESDNDTWPLECKNCKNQEQAQLPSRRQGSEQWYKNRGITDTEVKLIRLDYWVGDTCNLACAICGPLNSSTWKKEMKISSKVNPAAVNKFWKDLDLLSLQAIHFHGGEPLLSKEHVEFLQAVPYKNQVEITYNTNATVRASQQLLDLWKEFQLVVIDFSIDDIGTRFEYQRYPAVWDEVVDNLNWYVSTAHHNTMFNVNTTISWLNRFSVDTLSQWLEKNFCVSKYQDPIQHRKQFAVGTLDINQKFDTVSKYLDGLDQRRGTNWKQVFPELVNYCPGQTGTSVV